MEYDLIYLGKRGDYNSLYLRHTVCLCLFHHLVYFGVNELFGVFSDSGG